MKQTPLIKIPLGSHFHGQTISYRLVNGKA